jgi:ABC-2 type transport system permease protein
MNSLLISRRDIGALLHCYLVWFIVALVLFLVGVAFQIFALGSGAHFSHEVLETFFEIAGIGFNVAAVLITMRSFSEEAQMGTDVLFRTAPIPVWQVVAGKFIAAVAFLTLMASLSVYLPGLIYVNGKVSPEHVLVGYAGVLMMSGTVAAMGIAASTLFRSQVVTALVSVALMGTFAWFLWRLSDLTDPPFNDVFAYSALWDKHFTSFQSGSLHVRDVIFYASMSFLFLFGATKVLEGRRWQ